MISLQNAIGSPIFNGYSSFISHIVAELLKFMFNKNNGKMYYVNAYYDVIDDIITIYIVLEWPCLL